MRPHKVIKIEGLYVVGPILASSPGVSMYSSPGGIRLEGPKPCQLMLLVVVAPIGAEIPIQASALEGQLEAQGRSL